MNGQCTGRAPQNLMCKQNTHTQSTHMKTSQLAVVINCFGLSFPAANTSSALKIVSDFGEQLMHKQVKCTEWIKLQHVRNIHEPFKQ